MLTSRSMVCLKSPVMLNTHELDCEEEQHIAAEGSSHFCLKDQ